MLYYQVKPNETIGSIAMDFRMSVPSLMAANPGLKPNQIIAGTTIVIPGIRNPATIPYHVIIHLDQKILQLYHSGRLMKTYPIAVGKILTATPSGDFVVVNREPNPGGPFGAYWLSLSKLHYGIHGTNNPSSIGKAVSKGCVRMYNQDVVELASIIPNGTRVSIRS
ncbi:L,D-transpeptidase family protein [Bacillus capparidis]|uniref:Lipoprotein-anchoring transpeptidase ErfK/SrfK n=1 Tax=Bacillus capparidis TaxID=1840411 RepID=A0ABS4CQU5_9BACI|nr:L,D-transpeptidase family protein [Bacillus capparidis]MBP1079823.1 lipoprotein-anchoring transpeptidase ErfK/SrfK [Bacillus capparidis]MED1095212.1 L,D-transpeptidase family protein [Bacillus capparidis]